MKDERQKLIAKLEEMTDADVYILFTATGVQYYQISLDFLTLFTEAIFVRRKNRRKNAILLLETNGGDPTTVMAVVKQLRENYGKIFGYAFNRCFSSGTIGLLATDKIYMSKYALLTPIDVQAVNPEQIDFKPVIANYNAFIARKADEREMEFAEMYPTEYLEAIRILRYSLQTIYPNFEKHCKPEYLNSTWEYFNGGAGVHYAKISRKDAKDLGMKIKHIPEDIEEVLYDIINNYISETNMLVESLSELEVKDACFETLGLTYIHYSKYQEQWGEISKTQDDNQSIYKKSVIENKYRTEFGWKKE